MSEVQWNFSNLDRSDRIHMVFSMMQDLKGIQPEPVNARKNHYVMAKEHFSDVDEESQFKPVSKSRERDSPRTRASCQATSNPNMLNFNMDL